MEGQAQVLVKLVTKLPAELRVPEIPTVSLKKAAHSPAHSPAQSTAWQDAHELCATVPCSCRRCPLA